MSIHNSLEEKLPVLEAIIESVPQEIQSKLQHTLFVCVQHLLYTTFALIKSLEKLGAPPKNIHIMGKTYSTSYLVANKLISIGCHYYPNSPQFQLGCFTEHFVQDVKDMWGNVEKDLQAKPQIKYLIVLDDGGKCILHTPRHIIEKYKISGIEQTSSGLTSTFINNPNFPVIEVASSAAKQIVESPMIAEAVTQKVEHLIPLKTKKHLNCGVVGLGVIGVAVTHKLLELGHNVINYDKNIEKQQVIENARLEKNLDNVIDTAEYTFGCSGDDVTTNFDILSINADKYFISCSSQDKEFLSLLKTIEEHFDYNDLDGLISCKLRNLTTIKILGKGYPINFDNTGESVCAKDIQLTRGLLLGSVLQALLTFDESSGNSYSRHMLDPYIQKFVVNKWKTHGSVWLCSQDTLEKFNNVPWIIDNSGGNYYELPQMKQIFQ